MSAGHIVPLLSGWKSLESAPSDQETDEAGYRERRLPPPPICDRVPAIIMEKRMKRQETMRTAFLGFTAAALAAAALFLLQPVAAQAPGDEVSELRKKNGELEKRVEELEALLKECKDAGRSRFSADQGYQNKKNWRSLERGMDQGKVREILGEPLKVIEGVKTLWYYPNIYGAYVSFDENGRLTGWNEP